MNILDRIRDKAIATGRIRIQQLGREEVVYVALTEGDYLLLQETFIDASSSLTTQMTVNEQGELGMDEIIMPDQILFPGSMMIKIINQLAAESILYVGDVSICLNTP